MIPVVTRQKFKCDFCKKRSVKHVMEKHEKRCFRNPNRFCELCENKGYIMDGVEHYEFQVPCPYCSRFNKKQLEEIEAREAANLSLPTNPLVKLEDIPF